MTNNSSGAELSNYFLLNLIPLPKARKTAFYFLEEISSKTVNNSKLFELNKLFELADFKIIYFLHKRTEPQKRVFRI